jgi:hypothetical protein
MVGLIMEQINKFMNKFIVLLLLFGICWMGIKGCQKDQIIKKLTVLPPGVKSVTTISGNTVTATTKRGTKTYYLNPSGKMTITEGKDGVETKIQWYGLCYRPFLGTSIPLNLLGGVQFAFLDRFGVGVGIMTNSPNIVPLMSYSLPFFNNCALGVSYNGGVVGCLVVFL